MFHNFIADSSKSFIESLAFALSLSHKTRRGLGPIDNRPSTNKLHHFVKKKKIHVTCDTWHLTRDTWHVTPDTWHLKRDTWQVTCLGGWTFSYRLWFMILWRSGGKGSLNESVNDKAVYRTVPATPGLLKMSANSITYLLKKY